MTQAIDEQVRRIVAAHASLHDAPVVVDAERARAIKRALSMGYTEEHLIQALAGNAEDEWACAHGFHNINQVLKNADTIERYRAVWRYMNEPVTDQDGNLTGSIPSGE